MKSNEVNATINIDNLFKDNKTAYKYFFTGIGVLGLHDIYLKDNRRFKIRYGALFMIIASYLIGVTISLLMNSSLDTVTLLGNRCLVSYLVFLIILSIFDLITIPYKVSVFNTKLQNALDENDIEMIKTMTLYSKKEIQEWILCNIPLGIDNFMGKKKGYFICVMIPIWFISILMAIITFILFTSKNEGAEMWGVVFLMGILSSVIPLIIATSLFVLLVNIYKAPRKIFIGSELEGIYLDVNSNSLKILKENFNVEYKSEEQYFKPSKIRAKIAHILIFILPIIVVLAIYSSVRNHEVKMSNDLKMMVNSDGTLNEERRDIVKFDPRHFLALENGDFDVADRTFFTRMPITIESINGSSVIGGISSVIGGISYEHNYNIKVSKELLEYIKKTYSYNDSDYYIWGYFVKDIGNPTLYATKVEHIPKEEDGYHSYRNAPRLPYKEIEINSTHKSSNRDFTIQFEKLILEVNYGHMHFNIVNNSDNYLFIHKYNNIMITKEDFDNKMDYDVRLDTEYKEDKHKSIIEEYDNYSIIPPNETALGTMCFAGINDYEDKILRFKLDITSYDESIKYKGEDKIRGLIDLVDCNYDIRLNNYYR